MIELTRESVRYVTWGLKANAQIVTEPAIALRRHGDDAWPPAYHDSEWAVPMAQVLPGDWRGSFRMLLAGPAAVGAPLNSVKLAWLGLYDARIKFASASVEQEVLTQEKIIRVHAW